ncbi:DUF317 domain-containing protein [Streptomyces diacarni]|uniref:DUF317 domain-containing protein n=1 Tax=Streptomyces diacarni TaxID=2800381 RepID=UPI0033E1E2F9
MTPPGSRPPGTEPAAGATARTDPLVPRVLLSSPDRRTLLRLEPYPDAQWWTLAHVPGAGQAAWYARIGARTPVESIAGFIDALTDPAAATAGADPYEPLRQTGWVPTHTQDRFESPDGTTQVEHPDDVSGWFASTTLSDSRPVWEARFSEHTPTHLVAAFTAALADPRPVARSNRLHILPTDNTKLVTHTRREVPVGQVASALEVRVRALAARRALPAEPPSPRQHRAYPAHTR